MLVGLGLFPLEFGHLDGLTLRHREQVLFCRPLEVNLSGLHTEHRQLSDSTDCSLELVCGQTRLLLHHEGRWDFFVKHFQQTLDLRSLLLVRLLKLFFHGRDLLLQTGDERHRVKTKSILEDFGTVLEYGPSIKLCLVFMLEIAEQFFDVRELLADN